MRSEQVNELAAALSKAQGQFDHAKKDVKNEFFKSRYADLASVIDAAKKPLSDNGLSVVQSVDFNESGDSYLETILLHSSGQWINSRYLIKPMKSDPQAFGSAMTYARRYSFSAITGIASDDDDGNAASQGKPEAKKETKPAEPQPTIEELTTFIRLAKTLDELQKKWLTLTKPQQHALSAVKDEVKENIRHAEEQQKLLQDDVV